MGATRATNNTAEMQAMIGALYLVYSGIEGKIFSSSTKVMITVDSLYVKGLIDEKFVARENKAIAMLLYRLWKVVREKVRLTIRWVRGHSGDVGNTIADELADKGTRLEEKHRWWKRIQQMGNWDEFIFREKLKKLEKGKTLSEKARRIQWKGDLNFLRGDLPLLDTVTKAISGTHAACMWCKSNGTEKETAIANGKLRIRLCSGSWTRTSGTQLHAAFGTDC